MKELELAKKYQIFLCRAGSHAYGTNSAHSDVDTRGIFIAPPEYTLGCLKTVEQVELPGEDTVIYELAKFIKLAAEANPNIIELLFTGEENILFMDPAFAKLREHRQLFLSKKAKFTFSGYAMAQMKRIRGHHKWIEQEHRGVEKLRKLWTDGKITEEWLRNRFSEGVVKKVISENQTSKRHRGGIITRHETTPSGNKVTYITADDAGQEQGQPAMDEYLEDQDIRLISECAPELLDFATFITPKGVLVKGVALESNIAYGDAFLVKVNATTFRIFHSPHFKKPILSEDRKNIQFVDISEDKLSARLEGAEFLGTLIVQQDTYRVQHRMWKEYWQWKKNRNPARAELEEKYGFDCKHASHLIRLLKMSHEILRDGEVIVRRPDAEELLAIRDGAFDYDQLVETAERMDAELEALYEKSTLPHSADKEAINDLFMNIVRDYWTRVGL